MMNDPLLLLASKLEELVILADEANTGFEKAAVYAATQSILAEFDNEEPKLDPYALEKVGYVSLHINAAVGYGITNGRPKSFHISSAYGDVGTLIHVLKRHSVEEP